MRGSNRKKRDTRKTQRETKKDTERDQKSARVNIVATNVTVATDTKAGRDIVTPGLRRKERERKRETEKERETEIEWHLLRERERQRGIDRQKERETRNRGGVDTVATRITAATVP